MNYEIKHIEKLKYEIAVKVAAPEFASELDKVAEKEQQKVRLKGFRPGKVPTGRIKQVFGMELKRDVALEVMKRVLREIVEKENIDMAGYPQLQIVSLEEEKDFEFKILYDVHPEVKLPDFKDIALESIQCEITDEDVEKTLAKMREQMAHYHSVDRESKEGDRVHLDYKGLLDGLAFAGGAASNQNIRIGAHEVIPDLENGLIGLKSGDEKALQVKFPEDYANKDLAGKDTVFEVKIHKIEEAHLPTLDDDFAQKVGIKAGGLDELKSKTKDRLQREAISQLQRIRKKIIFDALAQKVDFDIPESLITMESDNLRNQMLQWFKRSQGANKGTNKKMSVPELPLDSFKEEATARVKLGLAVREFVTNSKIEATPAEIDQKIRQMAADYDEPTRFIEYYKNNKEEYERLAEICLEEKVVEELYKLCSVTPKQLTYEELNAYKA